MVAKWSPQLLAPLWYRALDAEYGIWIRASDRRSLTNALYTTRQGLDDERLQSLMIFQPAEPGDQVWIVQKTAELPEL